MIRKLTRMFAAAALLFIGGKTFAQTEKDTVYVFLQDMPDAGIYLPPPPDMLSPQYADDFAQGYIRRPWDLRSPRKRPLPYTSCFTMCFGQRI